MTRTPLLAAGVLLALAAPSTANDPSKGGPGMSNGMVPAAEVPKRANEEFQRALGSAQDARTQQLIRAAQGFFNRDAKARLDDPQYPQSDIDRIDRALMFGALRRHFKKVDQIYRSSQSEDQKQQQVRVMHDDFRQRMRQEWSAWRQTDIGQLTVQSLHQAMHAVPDAMPKPPGPGFPGLGDLLGLPTDGATPESALNSARDKLFAGDRSGALADLNRAISQQPSAEAHAMRGGLHHDEGRYAAARDDAKAALGLDPSNKQAVAVLHLSEGRVDGGRVQGPAASAGAASAAAANAGARGGGPGGGASLGASERSAAYGGLQAGGEGARHSSERLRHDFERAWKVGDYELARSLLERMIKLNPDDVYARARLAQDAARRGEYGRALAEAGEALKRDPKNKPALHAKALSEIRTRNWRDALASANTLIELDPNDPYALAYRSQALMHMGETEDARAAIRRAAELNPEFADEARFMAGVQNPRDEDILFLFPGERPVGGAKPAAAPAGGAGRRFGLLAGVTAVGGALLGLGLLSPLFGPLQEKLARAFTSRRGPSVGSLEPAFAPATAPAPAPAPAERAPGLIRGQYEISRQIGTGGMGMVYEGTDRSLGRRVAIKRMRDELRYDARERARFVGEAKTVAQLHHPNIVDIYAIAEEGDDVYLVFEYVAGRTVHDLVQEKGRLEPELAAGIVRAAADALEFAHGRGVIHRDMKPSNVMLDEHGRVKVMDFGIARVAKDAMTRVSMTNTVVGTPPYMAPEQEQGQVRKESDVYALAVCAYEMLTGRVPFAGIGGGMLLNKINMSYIPPARMVPGLPAALDEVFAKAFQAEPEKRYRTARQFADALETARAAAARA